MSIGAGIALIVIGAILVFAINVDVPWVDLDIVGYILMGAGVIIFLIFTVIVGWVAKGYIGPGVLGAERATGIRYLWTRW